MKVVNKKKILGIGAFILLCSTLTIGYVFQQKEKPKSDKEEINDSVSEINNINSRDNVVKADVFEEWNHETDQKETGKKKKQVIQNVNQINKQEDPTKDQMDEQEESNQDEVEDHIDSNQETVKPEEIEKPKPEQSIPPLVEEPGWTVGIY